MSDTRRTITLTDANYGNPIRVLASQIIAATIAAENTYREGMIPDGVFRRTLLYLASSNQLAVRETPDEIWALVEWALPDSEDGKGMEKGRISRGSDGPAHADAEGASSASNADESREALERERRGVSHHSSPAPFRSYWLLEHPQDSAGAPPSWWNGAGFTLDPYRAIRFVTKEECERVRTGLWAVRSDQLRSVSHGWEVTDTRSAEDGKGEPVA